MGKPAATRPNLRGVQAMRKAFDRQRRLDCPPVTKVSLNLNCRNETIPILCALQHIYSTPKVRDAILGAIARDVNGQSSAQRGRPGLSYWEILVLAAARLGCGCNYDQLQDLAENHRALRQAMGIGDWESEEKDQKRFDWRRIESNVNLLRPKRSSKSIRRSSRKGTAWSRRRRRRCAAIPLWSRPTSTIPRTAV